MDLSSELTQSAASMLADVYGLQSPLLRQFFSQLKTIAEQKNRLPSHDLCGLARGVISNAKAELEAGLTVKLRTTITGEVLSALSRLGNEILENLSEEAKNVASVLIAAAFEDLIRRMGAEFVSAAMRRRSFLCRRS